jgi:hypothetical protein
MTITDGLITLADARASLGWAATDTSNDADLEAYIEAATSVIENITGPVLIKSRTFTFDGGRESVVLPVPFTTVTSVTVNGVATTSFVADPDAGIITAGSTTAPSVFDWGVRNVVVVVSVGYAANAAAVASNVSLATRELVRFWWQQGRQANIPAFGSAPESMPVPQGFAVPKRVYELLEPSPRLAGFA